MCLKTICAAATSHFLTAHDQIDEFNDALSYTDRHSRIEDTKPCDARAADNANFIPSPHSQGHSFSRPLLQPHLIRYKLPQLGI